MAEPRAELTFPPVSPELLAARGATLREVRADLVRQDTGTRCRWWQGEHGTDLFAWWRLGDSKLLHVQLTFELRVLDVEKGLLRVGKLRPDTEGTGYCGRFDEWEVLPASVHEESVTAEARLLLSRVTTLPAQVLETLVRALDA